VQVWKINSIFKSVKLCFFFQCACVLFLYYLQACRRWFQLSCRWYVFRACTTDCVLECLYIVQYISLRYLRVVHFNYDVPSANKTSFNEGTEL